MTYELGTTTIEDLPAIVEMKVAMFAEAGHAALLAANARSLVLQDYERLYADDEAQHFVARGAGTIVACAGAFLKSDVPYRYFDPPVYGFLGDVYTQPAFRRQGLAKALSEHALHWLRHKGVRVVRLLASPAGRPLYTQLGFVASDEMILVDRAGASARAG